MQAKARELDLQLEMLCARTTPSFCTLSVELYGPVDATLVGSAERILATVAPPGPPPGTERRLAADAFAQRAEAELDHYRVEYPDLSVYVEVRDDCTEVMVANGVLLVPASANVSERRAEALLAHEVGTTRSPTRTGRPSRYACSRPVWPATREPRRVWRSSPSTSSAVSTLVGSGRSRLGSSPCTACSTVQRSAMCSTHSERKESRQLPRSRRRCECSGRADSPRTSSISAGSRTCSRTSARGARSTRCGGQATAHLGPDRRRVAAARRHRRRGSCRDTWGRSKPVARLRELSSGKDPVDLIED